MSERAKATVKSPAATTEKAAARLRQSECVTSSVSPYEKVIHLQKTFGNQVMQRLFKAGIIQTKLRIGQPKDIYEQEADRVADQVMRMPDTAVDSRQSIVRRRREVGGLKGKSLQMKPG